MAVTLTVNGTAFEYPEINDGAWGVDATNWASAITTGVLQKAGGNFTLTADANFGSNYGLVSPYFKSKTSNISSTGVVRFANTDKLGFRKADNSGDITLGLDTSNNLTFTGTIDLSSAFFTGDLSVDHFDSGTNASSATFLCGDGTWAAPSGSGSVNLGTETHLAYYASSTNGVSSNQYLTVDASGNLSATSFVGPLTGDVTGNLTGDVTGNALTCTTAATVTTNANLTGDVTSSGNTTTVAKIANVAVGTPTGTGNVVMSASPTLTDVPLAPTAATGTNTDQIATTKFVQTAANMAVPVSFIGMFAANSVPSGWLACTGAAVSRDTYSTLFSAIGTTYGVGNGTTTFNLPDMRAAFVRGIDSSKGIDTDRVFGSLQSGAYGAHTHTASVTDAGHKHLQSHIYLASGIVMGSNGGYTTLTSRTTSASDSSVGSYAARNYYTPSVATGISVTNTSSGSAETRPYNIALLYCIKY